MVIQEIQDNNIDITLLMETWLKDNEHDKAWVNQADLRTGYFDVLTYNGEGEQKEGGIAIKLGSLLTIEYGIWKYIHKNKPIHIIGIYHPPPFTTNNTSKAMFVDDLTELITNSTQPTKYLLEDFNIHTDNLEDNDAIVFNNTMEAMRLDQHIS